MVRRIRAAVVVLFLLPATAAVVGLGTGRASADSIASVQASINAQEAKISAESNTIHKLTGAYQQAKLQSSTLTQEIGTDRRSLRGLRAAVASTRSDLRQAAVRAYTQGVSTAPTVPKANPAVGSVYLTVASGDVSDTVDRLSLQRRQLGSDQARLGQELAANKVAVDDADKARQQAIAAASSEQTQLDNLQGRLQQLKAQAAAAIAAAANARAAAAAKAEAAKVAAEQAATQGAPVDNGLVSTVTNEVSDNPPAATPVVTSAPSAPEAASPVTIETPPTTEITPTVGTAPTTEVPATAAPTTPPTTAAPVTAPPTTAAPAAPMASPVGGSMASDLAELRQCESSGNYAANTGNGFYGAYQFSASTWTGLGYPGRPDLEPPAMQDEAAAHLAETVGWGQWPACSAALGL